MADNRRALLCFLVVQLFLPACAQTDGLPDQGDGYTTLSVARFMKTDQSNLPSPLSHEWSGRQLPDNWNISMPDQGGRGWYLLELGVQAPDQELWAVYLPYLNMTGDVFVNGTLIGSCGSMEYPLSRNWFRPLMFTFPGRLLKSGTNTIYVHQAAYANDGGGLSEVLVGHARDLRPVYEWKWSIRVLPAMLMFVMMVMIVVLVFGLVLLRPRDRDHLWLAAAAFSSALFSLNFFLRDIPFARHYWEALSQISLGMFIYCLMMYINRLFKFRLRRLEAACAIYFPLLGIGLIAAPEADQVAVYQMWHTGSIALAVLLFVLTARHWWMQKERDALFFAMGIGLVTLLGVHDWGIAQLNMEYEHLYLFQFAPVVILIMAAGLWLSRLVTALNKYEHINRNLNQRVAEKNAALSVALKETQLASAAKTRFFAMVSHDLRQPLHAMNLFLSGMDTRLLDTKSAYLVGKVRQGIKILRDMFDRLLDISQFETGKVTAEPSVFPLKPMLEQLYESYAPLFLEKGIRLRLFALDCNLYTDPLLVERILRNYLENALHYTEHGGALMGCRRRHGRVRIEVWDTGRGIPNTELQSIYDAFNQLDYPERTSGQGAGLGLAIVMHISRLLDLDISVRSQPGNGSVFCVDIPIAEADQMQLRVSHKPVAAQQLDGMRVWAVDDDELSLEGIEVLLESRGCLCRAFSAPQQVSQFLMEHKERPAIIISDFSLQDGITGPDVIAQVRRETDADVAAILITGGVSSDAQSSHIPVLRKPVDPDQLCRLMLNLSSDQPSKQD